MPRNARIPKVDRADPRLQELLRLMEELADERCGPSASFETRSDAVQTIGEELLRTLARQRTEQEGVD